MNAVLKKMNLKEQKYLLIINAPEEFLPLLKDFTDDRKIVPKYNDIDVVEFAIIFVKSEEEISQNAKLVFNKAKVDAIIWFAYPKKSSKKYKVAINRDSGWNSIGEYGYEPVRQVAIDADWSALRFKPLDKIKNLTRREEMLLTKRK